MDPLVGQTVDGRYKILAAMASGSMGAVYRAERVPVGKLVAVKFLHASFHNDAEFLARFERETRVMSKLAHPNCVSVLDFGMFEDAPYLVMEYVDGVTLRSILDDEIIAVPRAVGFAKQLAAGLAHAHSQNIIHRDVKPANIMIGDAIGAGEVVRILDFGLARLRGPGGGRDPTAANVVVGTPNYMAPEQTIAGSTLDARTDIYAVGIVLFEMITGERPFQADDTPSILAMHRTAPIPRLIDRVDSKLVLPDGLQDVIDRALAKSPADRYQSAIELNEALEALGVQIATGSQQALARDDDSTGDTAVAPTLIAPLDRSRPAERKGVSKVGLALASLVVAGGVAAAYVAHDRSAAPPPVPPHQIQIVIDAAIAAAVVVVPDAPEVDAPAVDASEPDAAVDATELPEIIMDPDPVNAEDPLPTGAVDDPTADNAADAPDTAPVETPEPPTAPPLAKSVHDAVLLIQGGQKDLALKSLRALWGHQENSAYIPFLIGNLYFDKRWWNVAMDHYRLAIVKNGGYKQNQVLTRNIIRMLGSKTTAARAETFLRKSIGRAALPALQRAGRSDANATVKKAAARIARSLR